MKKSLRYILLSFLFLASSQLALAQQYTVTGTVTDQSTDQPLVGANIFNKASGNGTITDKNGEFTLSLPKGATTLRISFIGYVTKMVKVSASNNSLKIKLKSEATNLDQLVVTGLASSQKRRNLANDVTKVSAKTLTGGTTPSSVGNALEGKIPGVKLNSWSGAPGGGVNFQIRGISTLGTGSSQPLIILDGVYLNNSVTQTGRGIITGSIDSEDNASNRLADLNPEDIKSIQVLKGPSAAAIYGQRANAGVVIITTKHGQAGQNHISIRENIGFNEAAKFLGRATWSPAKIKAHWDGNSARIQKELDRYNKAKSNGMIRDLEKVFYGNKGLINNTELSASGGNQKTQYFVSLGLNHEDGIVKNTGYKRRSIRANIDRNISKAVHISSQSNYIHTRNKIGFTNNQNNSGGSIGYDLAYTPDYAYGLLQQNSDGTWPDTPYSTAVENPFRLVDKARHWQKVNRFIQSLQLNADLFRQGASVLSFNAQGGIDYSSLHSLVYFPNVMQAEKSSALPGTVVHTANTSMNLNLQAILKFNTTVKGNSGFFDLGTQLGATRFDHNTRFNRLTGQGLIPGQKNVRNASRVTPTQSFTDGADVGFFAQQKVNWNDAMIVTVGGRADRSTLNLNQSTYYFYPKASLAINLTNFGFWTGGFFDQLKLRAAYGQTGGLPSFGGTFLSLGTANIGDVVGTEAPSSGVDPDLKPEQATGLEEGIDLAFLNNRVAISLTHYNKTVKNLILGLSPSPATGVGSVLTNAASLVNKGFELTVKGTPVQTRDVNWHTTVLWWTNKTTMTHLKIPARFNGLYFVSTRFREGYSPTAAWGTKPGESGRVKLGNFQPDYQMTWTNSISWRNLNVRFQWHTSQGFVVSNLSTFLSDGGGNSADLSDPSHKPDRFSLGTHSTRFLEDGSFIRLEQASVYYTISNKVLQSVFGNSISNIKVGVSGRNLLLFTDYSGYDPEVNATGRNSLGRKLSITPYPSSRQFMFHVSLNF